MTDERVVAFRDALREGDHTDAIANFDGFAAAIDDRELREGAVRNLARAIMARTPSDAAANQAAKDYVRALADASNVRNEARLNFLMYLQDGPPAGDVAETVDGVVEAHRAIDEAEDAMRSERDDVSIPPVLVVAGGPRQRVTVGDTFEVAYEVENVGTAALSDVALSVEGLGASIEPQSVATLEPDEAVAATVGATADEPGTSTLLVRASAGDAADERRTPVEVLAAVDYVESAHRTVEEAREQIELIVENTDRPHEGILGLEEKLEVADERLAALEAELSDGEPANGTGGRLGSVINQLGAVINQARALEGRHLSGQVASRVAHDAGSAIDDLAAARDLVGTGGRGNGDGPPGQGP